MKKIFGMVFGLLLGAVAFGQSSVVFTDAIAGYDKATAKEFHFDLSGFTLDQINSSAGYYTSYFTVKATEAGGKTAVVIALVDDSEMARRVISRFFVSLEVAEISASGANYAVLDFVDKWVMI